MLKVVLLFVFCIMTLLDYQYYRRYQYQYFWITIAHYWFIKIVFRLILVSMDNVF
jgi:hypothetical protein